MGAPEDTLGPGVAGALAGSWLGLSLGSWDKGDEGVSDLVGSTLICGVGSELGYSVVVGHFDGVSDGKAVGF